MFLGKKKKKRKKKNLEIFGFLSKASGNICTRFHNLSIVLFVPPLDQMKTGALVLVACMWLQSGEWV